MKRCFWGGNFSLCCSRLRLAAQSFIWRTWSRLRLWYQHGTAKGSPRPGRAPELELRGTETLGLTHWAWMKLYPHRGSEATCLENKSVLKAAAEMFSPSPSMGDWQGAVTRSVNTAIKKEVKRCALLKGFSWFKVFIYHVSQDQWNTHTHTFFFPSPHHNLSCHSPAPKPRGREWRRAVPAWGSGNAVAGALFSANTAPRQPAARSRSRSRSRSPSSAWLWAALWRTGRGWVGKLKRSPAGVARLGRRRGRLGFGSPACTAPEELSVPAAGGLAAGGEGVKRLAAVAATRLRAALRAGAVTAGRWRRRARAASWALAYERTQRPRQR